MLTHNLPQVFYRGDLVSSAFNILRSKRTLHLQWLVFISITLIN
jgi:hypothetical protein